VLLSTYLKGSSSGPAGPIIVKTANSPVIGKTRVLQQDLHHPVPHGRVVEAFRFRTPPSVPEELAMPLVAPRPWLAGALAVGAYAAFTTLSLAAPGLGWLLAALAAIVVLVVPLTLSERLFGYIESLGRATGRTRRYAQGGGSVAETTTTGVGLWLSSAINIGLTALGVLALALASGAIHLIW
jgi:hypothetical protein